MHSTRQASNRIGHVGHGGNLVGRAIISSVEHQRILLAIQSISQTCYLGLSNFRNVLCHQSTASDSNLTIFLGHSTHKLSSNGAVSNIQSTDQTIGIRLGSSFGSISLGLCILLCALHGVGSCFIIIGAHIGLTVNFGGQGSLQVRFCDFILGSQVAQTFNRPSNNVGNLLVHIFLHVGVGDVGLLITEVAYSGSDCAVHIVSGGVGSTHSQSQLAGNSIVRRLGHSIT